MLQIQKKKLMLFDLSSYFCFIYSGYISSVNCHNLNKNDIKM